MITPLDRERWQRRKTFRPMAAWVGVAMFGLIALVKMVLIWRVAARFQMTFEATRESIADVWAGRIDRTYDGAELAVGMYAASALVLLADATVLAVMLLVRRRLVASEARLWEHVEHLESAKEKACVID